MAYNPQMEQLRALQALTQQITNQYGGGNDVKSGILQNEAYVQGARQLGLTDADIAQTIRGVPWNDSTRYIPAQPTPQQGLMADELAPAPADAISGTIPAPAAPAPMPAPQQAAAPQAAPSFFQRMGQRFDQAATGGIIDPNTLTKDQRRMLRGQLLMNVGGALAQNRPVGEGFQQQYNMLTKRQADEQAKQIETTRKNILSGADISTKEGVMALLPQLAKAGLQDDLFKFSNYLQTAFPESLGFVNTSNGTLIFDKTKDPFNADGTPNLRVGFIMPGTAPSTNMTEEQRARMELDRARFGLDQRKFEFDQEKARRDAAAKGSEGGFNQRQQVGASAIVNNSYNYVEKLTGLPRSQIEGKTPAQIEQIIIQNGRRFFQGPGLGDVPVLSTLANRDLEAYSMGMAQGQASINNPTGPITGPDVEQSLRQQPNPRQDIETQARLIRQNLEAALGGSKPAQYQPPWSIQRIK
jgi:hypothetical protein